MIEIKEDCYKGTRILVGNTKRTVIDRMISMLIAKGFTEISIPIIQHRGVFDGKVGEENNHMMYRLSDEGNRTLCLSPEYTAVVMKLAKTYYKQQKDVKLFYVQECFRGEKPQAGRYRQFTQLGVEILNPTKDCIPELAQLAYDLIATQIKNGTLVINTGVKRGLDYYKDGRGFEISCEELGAQKQICGGGEYDGGVGFALGIDRLLNLIEE